MKYYYKDSFWITPSEDVMIAHILEKITEVGQAHIGFVIEADNEFDLALKVAELQDTLESNFQISIPDLDRSNVEIT